MANKGEISNLKAWLMVMASLLDDAALLALIFLVLRFYHVKITWPIILSAALAVLIFFIVMHKAVIPALRRRKVTGAEGMIGQTGEVTQTLKPQGVIIVNGEYWEAMSLNGEVGIKEDVEVVGINGLILEVQKKK
jgi:membrane-bound serine protease (ClpP class)